MPHVRITRSPSHQRCASWHQRLLLKVFQAVERAFAKAPWGLFRSDDHRVIAGYCAFEGRRGDPDVGSLDVPVDNRSSVSRLSVLVPCRVLIERNAGTFARNSVAVSIGK